MPTPNVTAATKVPTPGISRPDRTPLLPVKNDRAEPIKQEGAAEDDGHRERAEAREARPQRQAAREVADHRNGAADQRGHAGDQALSSRVLELGHVEAQLLASLRLEPDPLVHGDPVDDRSGLLWCEPFGAVDLDQLGPLKLWHRLDLGGLSFQLAFEHL